MTHAPHKKYRAWALCGDQVNPEAGEISNDKEQIDCPTCIKKLKEDAL